jgi:hypothetical protein
LFTRDEARRIASNIAKLAESAERRFLPADNSPQRQKDRAMPRGKSADVTDILAKLQGGKSRGSYSKPCVDSGVHCAALFRSRTQW